MLTGARIVAVIADKGVLHVVPEAYRLLGGGEAWLATATSQGMILGERVSSETVLDTLLGLVSRGRVAALLSRGAVCSESYLFLKNGSFARLATCSLAPLAREAIITGQPPRPARRNPVAVLYAYTQRLIRDGASLERLAAKIASKAGGRGAGILVSDGRQRLVLAVGEEAWLCVKHLGYAAIGLVSEHAGPGCRSSVVARLEPLGRGAARLVLHEIDKILYG